MEINIAVVPVAGLGTRLLPATKSQPKEMLPVGRKPVVQYVVEELARVGMQRILFIIGLHAKSDVLGGRTRCFADYCRERRLKLHDRNFSIRYETMISDDHIWVLPQSLSLFICRCLHPVPAGPLNSK